MVAFPLPEQQIYCIISWSLHCVWSIISLMFHRLITPTAILCIIPPLSTDFVIITDVGSSCEIARQGLILAFFPKLQIVSTLCSAYKVSASKFAVFPMASPNSSHRCFLETLQLVNSTWFHAVLSLCKFLSITGLPFPVISAVGLGEVQMWIRRGVNGYKENDAPFEKRDEWTVCVSLCDTGSGDISYPLFSLSLQDVT